MLSQTADEQSSVEALADNVVQQNHDVSHLVVNAQVDNLEVILGIEHVQVFDNFLIGNISLTERRSLVEDTQGIAHSTIRFFSNHSQSLFLVSDAFLVCHTLQVVDGVAHRHTLKVVNLTATENGRQNLMFLRSSQNEDDMCGWFLQSLKESIEGCSRQHVNLVDDEHLVFSNLWWDARLFHERLDVLHGIVGGSIQLKDVVRTLFVESLTALTLSTGLTLGSRCETIDGFGEDTSAGGFSHTSRSAEEVGVSQLSALHCVLQCSCQRLLSHHSIKGDGPVFSR